MLQKHSAPKNFTHMENAKHPPGKCLRLVIEGELLCVCAPGIYLPLLAAEEIYSERDLIDVSSLRGPEAD